MVEWHDLLGTPWRLHGVDRSGMDCSTVAEEVLRRTGAKPPSTSPFRMASSAGENNEMASYFGYLEDEFDCVGQAVEDARQTGDIVLAKDENGIARHLYVLVESERGTFLTASHNHGVVAIRRHMIGEVSGVYRLKEQPE